MFLLNNSGLENNVFGLLRENHDKTHRFTSLMHTLPLAVSFSEMNAREEGDLVKEGNYWPFFSFLLLYLARICFV